ncbi:hypothetical protein G6011_06972 [Alternaria panax]|uniref:RING-type domain-containing protein n=1 Tax=Alternaria panax TaxID=48097 RepID=A0AAD4FA58_9PLEO|nr:hypothetical protein G6011_06972 [Alternaria panax]
MATLPLAFADFVRRCLKLCGERNPSDEAHCPICTEKYDRGHRQAARVVVQLPAQCNHEFCRRCLCKIFARRKIQENANLCPLCRTTWFKTEYESVSARNQHLGDGADNAPPPHSSASRPFATPNNAFPRDSVTVPPVQREPRPYARTSRQPPLVARPRISTTPTQDSGDWRSFPVYLYREVHAAIAADRAKEAPTMPQVASSSPHHGPGLATPFSGTFPFGQQAASTTTTSQRPQQSYGQATNNRPAPGVYNHPPNETGTTTRGSGRNRAVPPLSPREVEFQRRAADLDAREAQLAQRELHAERERQEMQRRRQEFNTLTEQA